jgi:hypothetical protein
MPAVFFFADKVIDDPDTTLFAFGSLRDPRTRRLRRTTTASARRLRHPGGGWHALIALGTLCSQEPWLAVAGLARMPEEGLEPPTRGL